MVRKARTKRKKVSVSSPLDELISLTEAAKRYRLSTSYLRDIAISGRLKAQKIGHIWVTTPTNIESYINSRIKKGAFREDIET
jgi:hypothetical protein